MASRLVDTPRVVLILDLAIITGGIPHLTNNPLRTNRTVLVEYLVSYVVGELKALRHPNSEWITRGVRYKLPKRRSEYDTELPARDKLRSTAITRYRRAHMYLAIDRWSVQRLTILGRDTRDLRYVR